MRLHIRSNKPDIRVSSQF